MSIADQLRNVYNKTPEVYEAGKTAEYDKFWDKYQKNGTRTMYIYGFAGYGFGNENFYPKYDIKPTGDISKMFYDWVNHNTEPLNLKERLEECGVVLDISGANRIAAAFSWTKFTEIPALDVRGASSSALGYQENLFNSSKVLRTIGDITINENNLFKGWFSNCFELVDVSFIGTIGQNDFDIHYSTKLSLASLISILEACNKDVNASPITVKLPIKCIDGATDTEALLESLGGDFENTTYTYQANSLQLPHTNIKPNSVSLIPVDENGNQTNADWIDDGNGNIINPSMDNQFVGTIDYATGFIDISGGYGIFGILNKYTKCQYTVSSQYDIATNINGYNIAFA